MYIKNTINRLFQYRNCLLKFKELGFSNVYSYNLGKEAGVSAEQVRKDFSILKLSGNKKAGYKIDTLLEELNSLIGLVKTHYIVIVGMGNIGRALTQYNNWHREQKLRIIAAFDIDPAKHNKKYGIPVYPLESLQEIIEKYGVENAILAVPAMVAQNVCNYLTINGIKGILNFAPVILKVPERVIINNVNLTHELESLIYHVTAKKFNK